MRKQLSLNKRIMKRGFSGLTGVVLLALAVTFAFASPAAAHRKGPKKSPEDILAHMTDRLQLSDEQAEQIRPIIEDQVTKRRELFQKYHEQGRESRGQMRSEMQTLIEETDKQLEPILSDDQMAELKKMREERPQRMRKCFQKRNSSGSDS